MGENTIKFNNLLKASNHKFVINLEENSSSSSNSDNEEEIVKKKKNEVDRNLGYKIYDSKLKSILEKKHHINSLKFKLQETEQYQNRIKKSISKKNLNLSQMKSKIVQKQLKYRKDQSEVRKLYASYLTASHQMKDSLKQISILNDNLRITQKEIDDDKKLLVVLETKCKGLNKIIDVNLNDFKEVNENYDEGDEMSLASSDNQKTLILEHNDTRLMLKDKLTENNKITENSFDLEGISKIIDKKLEDSYKNSKTNKKIEVSPKKLNTKKNALLKKMIMIEERNEKEEKERNKKEETMKKKLLDEKKEKDISNLRIVLKNKQILGNAIINLKKDMKNLFKLNDQIEEHDLFLEGLTLFLDNTLDKSYLLENLEIKLEQKLSENLEKNNFYFIDKQQEKKRNYDLKLETSVLESIRAYRLSNNFEEKYIKNKDEDFTLIVDSYLANKVNPYLCTCNFDLNGKCNDDNCTSQHKNDFILNNRQKLIDILLYNPSITRFKGKIETKEDMEKLLKHLNNFIDNLEKKYSYNELLKYLVKLIRISDDESILIKSKLHQPLENDTICEMMKSNQVNTFPEFGYNFRLRDRENVLTYSKVAKLNKKESFFIDKNENESQLRFFNLNSVKLNQSLEDYCNENSDDIKSWIKLAYLQFDFNNQKMSEKKKQLQSAIKIIMQGLSFNRLNVELWKNYLFFFINLLNNNKNDECFNKADKHLHFVCKKILVQYPSYILWKFYLSLCLNYLDKELVSSEILDEISSEKIFYFDEKNNNSPDLISNAYLEILLYKANLYIEINKVEKAKNYLSNVLCSNMPSVLFIDSINFIKSLRDSKPIFNSNDNKKYQETYLLKLEDKVFLWLNYIYLFYFNRLPNEKFEPFKQGFSSLKNKKPFLIKFGIIKKTIFDKLLGIFVEALNDCFLNSKFNSSNQFNECSSLKICLPLFHNLANLYFSANKKKTALLVFDYLASYKHQSNVSLLINKALFEEKNSYNNEAFYTLGDTKVYKLNNFDIIYYLCLLHFKNGEYKYFNYESCKILNIFFEFDTKTPISIAYKRLLSQKEKIREDKVEFLQKINLKLWALYLMSEILTSTEDDMDSVLCGSISLSKLNKNIDAYTIELIHFLYLNFYVKTIINQDRLDIFFEKLQYSLLQIDDHRFQFYLLKHFSNCFFSSQMRMKFFLKFLFLIPKNKLILNYFLNLAFNKMNLKKICYQVLNYYIERKELKKILEPLHWFLVIYLAIDFKEHLNIHNYFQLAISDYPYNKQLWHYLLAYETSQMHEDHIQKARSIIKNLKIPDLEKVFYFD